MKRENIILSDIDLEILWFLKKKRTVGEIGLGFCFFSASLHRHLDRLEKLGCITHEKVRTQNWIKINEYGQKVLALLRK